jgi:hypothetical protein
MNPTQVPQAKITCLDRKADSFEIKEHLTDAEGMNHVRDWANFAPGTEILKNILLHSRII